MKICNIILIFFIFLYILQYFDNTGLENKFLFKHEFIFLIISAPKSGFKNSKVVISESRNHSIYVLKEKLPYQIFY